MSYLSDVTLLVIWIEELMTNIQIVQLPLSTKWDSEEEIELHHMYILRVI